MKNYQHMSVVLNLLKKLVHLLRFNASSEVSGLTYGGRHPLYYKGPACNYIGVSIVSEVMSYLPFALATWGDMTSLMDSSL